MNGLTTTSRAPKSTAQAGGKAASEILSEIWRALETLTDPEIPVVSLREMGILRDVRGDASQGYEVVITPTYSGCPAMEQIHDDVLATMQQLGHNASVVTQLAPAWTTDWMTEEAREKLRMEGIAPPLYSSADKRSIMGVSREILCPRCRSKETKMISQFGSTACKSLYVCEFCKEPFDYFKCI